ncbi:hypothetical protein HMPREF1318_2492 [Actinomyces massiliensis F0489]|uniref:Uncharacterized protein n=2 Tax=Actinomyces TaxID=1654 RepID=J0WS14_9ACTO|nr:hypothetical protein HMPREF1318_2492 [Actinomyces massiliensis F0489]
MLMRVLPGLSALLLAVVLLPVPRALAQTSAPDPGSTAVASQVQGQLQEQVEEWAAGAGQDVARQATSEDASVSSPVNVETWSEGVLEAADLDDPTDPTTTWVAVISTAEGPVGVLVIDADGSEPSGAVQQDAELAAALAALPERAIVLRQPAPPSAAMGSATPSAASPQSSSEGTADTDMTSPASPATAAGRGDAGDADAENYADAGDSADPAASDAWYALVDEVVTALDEQAMAGMSGPVGLPAYAQVLYDRTHHVSDTDKAEPQETSRTLDMAIVYTGLGVLVIGMIIVTTTFVHERRVMAPLREGPESQKAKEPDQTRTP